MRPHLRAVLLSALLVTPHEFARDAGALIHESRAQPPPGDTVVALPQLRGQLADAWAGIGRRILTSNAGAIWDSKAGLWTLDPRWRYADTATAPFAYYLEHALRPALTVAQGEPDPRLLDELSAFFVVYHQRFVTLGSIRRRAAADHLPQLLDGQGPDSTLTLSWLESAGTVRRWRECALCNAQALHPAARLLRIIAALKPSVRTNSEREFARLYAPLLVDEHLLRLGYAARWSFPDHRLPSTLVGSWVVLRTLSPPSVRAYYDAVQDRDLWLIATAAEVLGANKHDPALVELDAGRRAKLEQMVQAGVALVESRRHNRRVRTAGGQTVSADSYFDGEYDDHPDMQYAGDTTAQHPSGRSRVARKRSWDVSHIYRLPVLFRSLIENRSALNVTFPTATDVTQLVNEYVYVVFAGDPRRPRPHNFFDGSDGWYRAGASGGYPPSAYCDSRVAKRSCLASEAALYGWELLAFASSPLRDLQSTLLRLSMSADPAAIAFRDRYYSQGGRPFALQSGAKSAGYSIPLYVLLSARVDNLR